MHCCIPKLKQANAVSEEEKRENEHLKLDLEGAYKKIASLIVMQEGMSLRTWACSSVPMVPSMILSESPVVTTRSFLRRGIN